MKLEKIIAYLAQVEFRGRNDKTAQTIRNSLAKLKTQAVSSGSQFAKEIWCYEEILKIQENYLKAFIQMKSCAFYEGWCTLEQVEISMNFLEKHFNVTAENDKYWLSFIKTHTERFQSLYPYKFFISPGALHLEKRCSICDSIITLKNNCNHVPGEIYNGEMCHRNITKARLLELSVVTNPVQKYSVMFITDQKSGQQVDNYDYSLVHYVIRGLRTPFHSWNIRRTTTLHPHHKFKDVGRNDLCPCESGKVYRKCCLRKAGVLRPHVDIIFSVAPPPGLPQIEYTY